MDRGGVASPSYDRSAPLGQATQARSSSTAAAWAGQRGLPVPVPLPPAGPPRARERCRTRPGNHPRPEVLSRRGRGSPNSCLRCPGRAQVLVFPFVAVVLSIVAGPAVLVMHYAVLSQQKVSRELPAVRCSVRGRGTHLRKQVQGSVAHGTSGGGSLPGSAPRPRLFRGVT